MPSSYTSPIYEGQEGFTFRDYALRCAHAFVIEMRDQALEADLPEESLADTAYDDKHLKQAVRELVWIVDASPESIAAKIQAEYDARKIAVNKANEKAKQIQARYFAMLSYVYEWGPPESHWPLKDFMLEQLQDSMKFDGMEMSEPVLLEHGEWRKQRVEYLTREINYHVNRRDEKIEQARTNTEWMRALMESLQPHE